jgi:hypothetical protein
MKFQAFREKLFAEPFLLRASGETFVELSARMPIYKIDFRYASIVPEKTFVPFRISKDGRLDGFLGWFEATLCPGVTISNSPNLPLTNWWQLYFPTLEQVNVRSGQSMVLELEPKMVAGEINWSYTVRTLDS